MVAVGKLLLAASLTGTLAVGAAAWNGGENLQAVKSYAMSMSEKVSGLAGDISFLNSSISGKNEQIDKQKGKIAELEATIAQLTTERDALQAEVNRLTEENAQIPELKAQIETLKARIAELEGQVAGLQASLASLQADYDNAVAEIEKANAEISKANQESQELKDYAATLEAESTNTYNGAKVDRTNPMYAVEETNPTNPDEFPTLQGKGWNDLTFTFIDNDVKAVINSIIKASVYQVASSEGSPDLTVWLAETPIYHDGDLDALMAFLVEHTNIVNKPSSFNVEFFVLNSNTHIVTYNIHVDDATGQYVVNRVPN